MARLALKVAKTINGVKVAIHYTKTREGAVRWKELSKGLKGLAPVPSIFINGKLEYDQTPQEEELKERLLSILNLQS